MSEQRQRAGANSQQIQAGGDVTLNSGVSAAEVVEIIHLEVSRVKDELSLAAAETASRRVEALERAVIERFEGAPELFGAFAEPDFQYSLQDAARSAACNGEEHTEQLLVDLLANRAEQGAGARIRMATGQAVKAAENISTEVLSGLTWLWALSFLGAEEEDVDRQLASTEEVIAALAELERPSDSGWVSDADALGLLRMQTIFGRTGLAEATRGRLARQLVPGIPAEELREQIDALSVSASALTDLLVPHQLKPGFLVLPGKDREDLAELLPADFVFSDDAEQLVSRNGYGAIDQQAVEIFDTRVKDSETIAPIATWMEELPAAQFSVVGDVVGFVNVRRFIPFGGATTIDQLLRLRSSS